MICSHPPRSFSVVGILDSVRQPGPRHGPQEWPSPGFGVGQILFPHTLLPSLLQYVKVHSLLGNVLEQARAKHFTSLLPLFEMFFPFLMCGLWNSGEAPGCFSKSSCTVTPLCLYWDRGSHCLVPMTLCSHLWHNSESLLCI